MGFKFKRIDLVAGSAEFPSGDSDVLRRSRSETVLNKCVQAIIDCNCGWSLDTSKNATITNYVDIPSNNSNLLFPGLFLINNTSGCKLFVSYFANKNQYGIKEFSGTGADIFQLNSGTDRYTSGLCMSLIPEGSNAVFGDPTTTTFLPNDATRIIGTVGCSTSYNDYGAYAFNAQSGYVCSWGLFVSPYTLAVTSMRNAGSAGNLGVPVYIIGRVFGTLLHSEDSGIKARYGVITLRNIWNVSYEGTGAILSFSSYSNSPNSKSFLGNDPNGQLNTVSVQLVMGSIARSNGNWICGTDETHFVVTLWPDNVGQLSPFIHTSTSGNSRWTPFVVSVESDDLPTYGIVSGDGMKGYLDTDLFRCAIGTYGQQFDNGDFICVDSTNNFLIGWDSTNTDSIAGT